MTIESKTLEKLTLKIKLIASILFIDKIKDKNWYPIISPTTIPISPINSISKNSDKTIEILFCPKTLRVAISLVLSFVTKNIKFKSTTIASEMAKNLKVSIIIYDIIFSFYIQIRIRNIIFISYIF